jgi:hypothetical protein
MSCFISTLDRTIAFLSSLISAGHAPGGPVFSISPRGFKMNCFKSLFYAAVFAGTATAGHATVYYAAEVVSYTPGVFESVWPYRDDPASALGAADGDFLSLGIGGEIVLSFGIGFHTGGLIYEETYYSRSNHKESADIYASSDGVTWDLVASVTNASGATSYDVSGSYSLLKIVDTSDITGSTFDGFDLDAISVTAPLPAAGLLLGGVLVGAGLLRHGNKSGHKKQA